MRIRVISECGLGILDLGIRKRVASDEQSGAVCYSREDAKMAKSGRGFTESKERPEGPKRLSPG